MDTNYFEILNGINFTGKTKKKGNLTYNSWAVVWSEVKKLYPDAFYTIYERNQSITTVEVSEYPEIKQDLSVTPPVIGSPKQVITVTKETTIPINYFTDGRTAWVKVGVTINGIEHIEELPIMNNRNNAIGIGEVDSCAVNRTIQRAITKACARHGAGLYIYAGEDFPDGAEDEAQQDERSQEEIFNETRENVTALVLSFMNTPQEGDVAAIVQGALGTKRISQTVLSDLPQLLKIQESLSALNR